jgi:hypothetical protein
MESPFTKITRRQGDRWHSEGKFPLSAMKPKSLFVAVTGILSLLYLLNPTFGLAELIPDNFPLLGNLDEAAATTLLLACLAYFGVDLTRFFKASGNSSPEVVDVEGEVIEQPK